MEKAFDSISYDAIFDALAARQVSPTLVEYIKFVYANSRTFLCFQGQISPDPVKPTRKVRQCDPLSPLLFLLVFEEVLRSIPNYEGYVLHGKKINHIAYADELVLVADSITGLNNIANKILPVLHAIGHRMQCPPPPPPQRQARPASHSVGWLGVQGRKPVTLRSAMETTFAYRAIVFGIKEGKTFQDSLPFKKKLKLRSIIISEHPAGDEECEYRELHYHGLIEHPEKYRFDSDRVMNELKPLCTFFKSEIAKLPINFLAYLNLPPRNIIYENILENSDLPCLQAQVTPELINEVKERKIKRINEKREGSNDIMKIKEFIILTKCFSPTELLNEMCKKPHLKDQFEMIYCKRTYDCNFKKALNFAVQETLDKYYLDLAAEYVDDKRECMSLHQSADLMDQWIKFQGINPQEFCNNFLHLLDHKHRKLNCIILQGAPNSGKTYIAKSLEKATIFYAEVTQAVAGYSFMWMDCINKRLIVINEPFFSNNSIEELKMVLEGTGCRVKCKGKGDEYLRPTPVLITSNVDVWCQCPEAKDAILARCLKIYDNLKPCPFLKNVYKDLHPRWLGILLIRYAKQVPGEIKFDDSDDECPSPPPSQDTAAPNISIEKSSTISWKADGKNKRVIFDSKSTLLVRNRPVRYFRADENFKYLGVNFTPRGRVKFRTDLEERLNILAKSLLKPQQKFFFLVKHLLPSLYYQLSFAKLHSSMLKKLDISVRKFVRTVLHMPKDVPVAAFHANTCDGGLDVPSLRWIAPLLAANRGRKHHLPLLKCDGRQIRTTKDIDRMYQEKLLSLILYEN
ncbi:Retrovirus-related Pol polyprotein type-2 like protein [Argiope bruennichi]|uniref:Retrovirus-related Pol polyprotein type-2 like protein n=1 Tax=Argiope bruennichi TaxID=94029 RepID=A0A8T0FH53_ARGBR|nr:Retrovirus-related Pol polyprotein type-2 like protein [Argiope bruennichi]